VYYKIAHPGTALALEEIEQKTERGGDIMKAPNKTATICQWVTDSTDTCLGQTRARVAEVMVTEPIPGRIYVPAGGVATRVRKVPERIVKYEKRGPVGVITARVQNIGEAYDEIDALLDRIEQDKEVQVVAIYTLDGLFASLPIR
jgi:hypothetical protein